MPTEISSLKVIWVTQENSHNNLNFLSQNYLKYIDKRYINQYESDNI